MLNSSDGISPLSGTQRSGLWESEIFINDSQAKPRLFVKHKHSMDLKKECFATSCNVFAILYIYIYVCVYIKYIFTHTHTHEYILKPFLPAVSTFTLQDLQIRAFKAIMISSFWDLHHFKY